MAPTRPSWRLVSRRCQDDDAFALIDAIVALAVLMIVFVPAALLMMNATEVTGGFRAKMVAESVASGILAQERSSAANPACLYQQSVLALNPTAFWPMDDQASTSDTVANVSAAGSSDDGTAYSLYGWDVTPGPVSCDTASGALAFNGSGYVSTGLSGNDPQPLTIAVWFETSSANGGIIQFANTKTGLPSNYDRHLYVNANGNLVFGVCDPNSTCSSSGGWVPQTIQSPQIVNDGEWHFAVATLSSAGMALYLDGQLVATDSSVTEAQDFSGYWRIGELGNAGGWPTGQGGTYPGWTVLPLNGEIADAAVWQGDALNATQVASLWQAASGAFAFPPQSPAQLPKLWYQAAPFPDAGTWCPQYSKNPPVPCSPIVQTVGGVAFDSYVTGGWCALSNNGQWGNGTVPSAPGGVAYFISVKVVWGPGRSQTTPRGVSNLSAVQSVVESTELPLPPDIAPGSSEPEAGWSVADCPVGLS